MRLPALGTAFRIAGCCLEGRQLAWRHSSTLVRIGLVEPTALLMQVIHLVCVECFAEFAAEAFDEIGYTCPFCGGSLVELPFSIHEPPDPLEPGLNVVNRPTDWK